jgi:hypothetical protein
MAFPCQKAKPAIVRDYPIQEHMEKGKEYAGIPASELSYVSAETSAVHPVIRNFMRFILISRFLLFLEIFNRIYTLS